MRETLNDQGPPASDDIIEFPSAFSTGSFMVGGVSHTLELIGFGESSDALRDRFTSPEGQGNATRLWGRITRQAAVPDGGATLGLLAFACGLLGAVAKRRMAAT